MYYFVGFVVGVDFCGCVGYVGGDLCVFVVVGYKFGVYYFDWYWVGCVGGGWSKFYFDFW